MSATTPTAPTSRGLDVSQTGPIPFGRLVKVELRKMADTRGNFWLAIISGVLLAVIAAIVLLVIALADDVQVTAYGWSSILTIPLSLLLPVFAILTVTSEWSQRSGLVTFTLEPHRLRVLLAKLTAVVAFAVAIVVVAFVLGAIGNVIGAAIGGYSVEWDLGARELIGTLVVQLLYFLMAFGLGCALLSTPGAIAVFYVVALLLPLMVYSTLYAFFDWARSIIPWIDLNFGTQPFLDPNNSLDGLDWARALVATLIWVVVPMVLGGRRVLSNEPK